MKTTRIEILYKIYNGLYRNLMIRNIMDEINTFRIIGEEGLKRKHMYGLFSKCADSGISFTVRMDVTETVRYSKATGTSFFINTLYAVSVAVNSIEEMRYRILNGEIVCFDKVDPGYTVTTGDGMYRNCKHRMSFDYGEFYKSATETIETAKKGDSEDGWDDRRVDEIYFSCVPWIDFTSVRQPLPIGDREGMSIPRIMWGKFTETDGKYLMSMDIAADHSFIDGRLISDLITEIQKRLSDPEKYLV